MSDHCTEQRLTVCNSLIYGGLHATLRQDTWNETSPCLEYSLLSTLLSHVQTIWQFRSVRVTPTPPDTSCNRHGPLSLGCHPARGSRSNGNWPILLSWGKATLMRLSKLAWPSVQKHYCGRLWRVSGIHSKDASLASYSNSKNGFKPVCWPRAANAGGNSPIQWWIYKIRGSGT